MIKDIDELLNEGVIDSATAERIRTYYSRPTNTSTDRQLIVFAILGALLVGLGIILIVAHNWDELNRGTKLFFSFLPLLIAQVLSAYCLSKKTENKSWREGSAVFLILAVGACISMVSQVYNIPSDLGSFLLSWVVLALPVVYVMRSYLASMMVIAGATWYGAEVGYFSYSQREVNYYPLLMLAVVPYLVKLYRAHPQSNAASLHSWLLSLSVLIMLGNIAHPNDGRLLVPAYMGLAAILYLIGSMPFMNERPVRSNGFLVIGSLATIAILLMTSFSWYWEELSDDRFGLFFRMNTEMIAAILTNAIALILFIYRARRRPLSEMRAQEPVFLIFILLFAVGTRSPYVFIAVNFLLLIVSLLIIRDGLRRDHLGILNYGLLIMMALVVCRFFDADWSFVVRGLLFIAVGAGFFIANRRLVKQRKSRHED